MAADTSAKSCWEVDLHTIQSTLIDLAKRAGEMIISAKPVSATASGTKKNSADLVTETDQAVEQMISSALLVKYPTFKFLGEETYKPGMRLGPEPTFVVDPIDGTTNFVHGWQYVSISLGFAIEKEPKNTADVRWDGGEGPEFAVKGTGGFEGTEWHFGRD
ncbi:hypothetical protein DV736_g5355, partial [Chaetothyriales sp. CBS 134916]